MGTTTMGVKLDDATRERIKSAATRIDRTPHWLIKQAIFSYLEQLENSDTLPELPALLSGAANEPACRSQLLNRRTNWRINWPINCVIKKMPVVAQVWSRGYCRSFRCHRRKAWR